MICVQLNKNVQESDGTKYSFHGPQNDKTFCRSANL